MNYISRFRHCVGIMLRIPIVALLALAWVVYLWWWIFALTLVVSISIAIIQFVASPLVFGMAWLWAAIRDKGGEVFPGYWGDDYPRQYIDLCERAFKLGFPTLRRWLMNGF